MNSNQHALAKRIFLHAIVLQPNEITPYIISQTENQQIIKQVQDLIKIYQTNTKYTYDFVEDIAENISKSPLLFPSERYTLIKKIGQGGMGDVYLAQRKIKNIKQKVAIKILQLSDILSRSRFTQEASILSQLSHPNISQFIDADFLKDGRPYVVMEYAEGKNITEYCQHNGLDIKACLNLFKALCNAVEHAHRNLIVHRDIKPDNIIIDQNGKLMLLDFGIAKIIQKSDNHTKTQMRAMTPAYASPEQFMGKAVSVSSDVYSLGVLLYELLTGARPYEPKNHSPIEFQQILSRSKPQKPSEFLIDKLKNTKLKNSPYCTKKWIAKLSGDLDKIILKSLQFDVSQRYQSVAELLDDLSRYKNNLPVLAHSPSIFYSLDRFVVRNNLLVVSILVLIAFSFYTFRQKIILNETSVNLQFKNDIIKEQRNIVYSAKRKAENLAIDLSRDQFIDRYIYKQNLDIVIADKLNIATGYLFHQETIDLLNGSFNINMTYSSNLRHNARVSISNYNGRKSFPKYFLGIGWNHHYTKWMGSNWSSVFDRTIAYSGDGRLFKFIKQNDRWVYSSIIDETFKIIDSKNIIGQFIINNPELQVEHNDKNKGYLAIENKDKALSFNYRDNRLESVQDNKGAYINFAYNNDNNKIDNQEGNQIDSITNHKGNKWTFKYDLFKNLSEIEYPNGIRRAFIYHNSKHFLKNITSINPNNNSGQLKPIVSFHYDPFNRVYRILYYNEPCENQELLIVYNNDMTRTVTNSQGEINTYTVEKIDNVWSISNENIEFEYKKCLK